MIKHLLCIILAVTFCAVLIGTETDTTAKTDKKPIRLSFSTTYLSLMNFGEEKTNTHHYELHIGYQINL